MRIEHWSENSDAESGSINLLQIVAAGKTNESNENRKREENLATSYSERQHQ
jgi:hypothetical protein